MEDQVVRPAPRLVDGEPLCDPMGCLNWHKNQWLPSGEIGEGCKLHPACMGTGDVCVPGLRAQRDQALAVMRRLRFEAVGESVAGVLHAALTNSVFVPAPPEDDGGVPDPDMEEAL